MKLLSINQKSQPAEKLLVDSFFVNLLAQKIPKLKTDPDLGRPNFAKNFGPFLHILNDDKEYQGNDKPAH